ncbi:response regulator transcription factor [Clostridium neuense]|uniref:Stage 0 sporulation protein A homolog n=1 Tax=Clostridium neuense TaxID=1728934 RepID=A0ABW8TKN7_9CLOT
MGKRILIVEDDEAISNLININLNMVGYESKQEFDGIQALETIKKENFDLIIMDIMLPGMDGFRLMEKIKDKNIPVIFLTAKNSVIDKVKGLKLGAEDYMVKPFETIELLTRIEVVLRRYGKNEDYIEFKDLKIYEEERIVKRGDEKIELTLKEFELLTLLIKNKNIALSREQILEQVWGYEYFGETRTVDTHVQRIRKKLGLLDNIKTVYKVGYRLED